MKLPDLKTTETSEHATKSPDLPTSNEHVLTNEMKQVGSKRRKTRSPSWYDDSDNSDSSDKGTLKTLTFHRNEFQKDGKRMLHTLGSPVTQLAKSPVRPELIGSAKRLLFDNSPQKMNTLNKGTPPRRKRLFSNDPNSV